MQSAVHGRRTCEAGHDGMRCGTRCGRKRVWTSPGVTSEVMPRLAYAQQGVGMVSAWLPFRVCVCVLLNAALCNDCMLAAEDVDVASGNASVKGKDLSGQGVRADGPHLLKWMLCTCHAIP
eukprot:347927-Chlamydomonas_euryale.AAC.2